MKHLMSESAKTFKVLCAHAIARSRFMCVFLWRSPTPRVQVRSWSPARRDQKVMITMPRIYIEAEALVRGLTSRAVQE